MNGRGKASRLVREARWRAQITQTELARRAGVPIQTVHRIEHGKVDPRLGTLERLLAGCESTLVRERRAHIDRSEIRELLGMPPLARLGWNGQCRSAGQIVRLLGVLCQRGVVFVIDGAVAERLQGAPVPVGDLSIRLRIDEMNRRRLELALRAASKRLFHPPLTARALRAFEASRVGTAFVILPDGWRVPVMSIDDLIGEEAPDRAELLRAVREEVDAKRV